MSTERPRRIQRKFSLRSQKQLRERARNLVQAIESGRISAPSSVLQALKPVALGETTATAIDVLAKLLRSDDSAERVAAASCIAHAASYIRSDETTRRYSSDETPTLLREGLSDERLEVQRDLLKAFPRLRFASKDILPRLVELLSAEQPEVREAAIGAIRCLGIDVASGACQKIAERLADPTPSLRVAVCRVLSWLGLDAVSSIPALVCCVAKDENPDVLRSAARALVIIDPDGEHVSLVDKPTERHALIDALRLLGETGRDFRRSLESRWASSDRESPPLHAYWMTQTEIGRQLNVSSKTVARDIAKKKLRVKGQKGKGTGRLFLVAQEELDRCKRPVTHDPGKK